MTRNQENPAGFSQDGGRPRVRIETFGCKVNHYESQALSGQLQRHGGRAAGAGPYEIIIINSCAVTAEAVRQSLQSLRRYRQRYPRARLAFTGCAAAIAGRAAESVADIICGNAGKDELVARLLDFSGPDRPPQIYALRGELPIDRLRAGSERRRTRAEVKIQDGCNSFCRYCIIPYMRGRIRSLESEKVLAECCQLAAAGFRELVLTGIHIGSYGLDRPGSDDLTALLRRLIKNLPSVRFRLGSLQPHEINPELLEMITSPDVPLCEHLHLSLQSASDRVLGAMGRPYRRREIENLLGSLSRHPHLAVGTDLIVGFPAETETAFRETSSLLESFTFAYLHVFPYSPRQGTVAACWPDRVSPAEKKQRAAWLAETGRAGRRRFRRGNLGRTLEVLVEKRYRDRQFGAVAFGHSRNYLPVLIRVDGDEKGPQAGAMVKVRPLESKEKFLLA